MIRFRLPTLATLAHVLMPRLSGGRALADAELRTLERVAEVLLEGAPHDVAPRAVASNVEAFLVAGRSRRAWRVRVLMHAIELAPLLTSGRRFSALSRSERRRLVETEWSSGRHVWRICAKVRNLVVLGAYGDARAAAQSGYVPASQRPRLRRFVARRASASVQP